MPENKAQILYDAIKERYTLPDFDTFSAKLNDKDKRVALYGRLTQDGYSVGDFDSFSNKVLGNTAQQAVNDKESIADVYPKYSTTKEPANYVEEASESPEQSQPKYPPLQPKVLNQPPKANQSVPTDDSDNQKSGLWDSYIGDMIEGVGSSVVNMYGNTIGSINKSYDAAYKLLPYDDKTIDAIKLINPFYQSIVMAAPDVKKTAEKLSDKSNRYGFNEDGSQKTFVDMYKEGDYAGMAGDVFLQATKSLPQSVVAMTAGAPGLALVGVLSANEKYDVLDKDNPDMGEVAKVSNAILTGASEALSEYSDKLLGKYTIGPLLKLGDKTAKKQIYTGVESFVKNIFSKYGLVIAPVVEGVEEYANRIATNIIDKATGADKTDKPITDGGLEAFVYGAGGGMQFSMIGGTLQAGQKINKHIVYKAYTKAAGKFSDIELGQLNNISDANIFLEQNPESAKKVANFMNAKAAYDRVTRRAENDIDYKIQQSASFIDGVSHKDGNVYDINLGNGGRAYIVIGNIVFNEDGTVNRAGSDSRVTIKTLDGKAQMIPTTEVQSLISRNNAEEFKSTSAQSIQEQEIQKVVAELETPSAEEVRIEAVNTIKKLPKDGFNINIDGVIKQARIQDFNSDGVSILIKSGSQTVLQQLQPEELTSVLLPEQALSENTEYDDGDIVITPDGRQATIKASIDDKCYVEINDSGETVEYAKGDIKAYDNDVEPTYQNQTDSAVVVDDNSKQNATNVSEDINPIEPGQSGVETAQAPKQTFPVDGNGDTDYSRIIDPKEYAQALLAEFGDDSTSIVDEDIESQKQQLLSADKNTSAIVKAREKKKISTEIDRLNAIRSFLTHEGESTSASTPEGDNDLTPLSQDPVSTKQDKPITPIQTNSPRRKTTQGYQPKLDAVLPNGRDGLPTGDQVLYDIANGDILFLWGDNGKSKGVESELFGKRKGSKRRAKAVTEYSNTLVTTNPKTGSTPEQYAERLAGMNYNQDEGIDSTPYRDIILDVLQSITSRKDAFAELNRKYGEGIVANEDFDARAAFEQEQKEVDIFGMTREQIDEITTNEIENIDKNTAEEIYNELFLNRTNNVNFEEPNHSENGKGAYNRIHRAQNVYVEPVYETGQSERDAQQGGESVSSGAIYGAGRSERYDPLGSIEYVGSQLQGQPIPRRENGFNPSEEVGGDSQRTPTGFGNNSSISDRRSINDGQPADKTEQIQQTALRNEALDNGLDQNDGRGDSNSKQYIKRRSDSVELQQQVQEETSVPRTQTNPSGEVADNAGGIPEPDAGVSGLADVEQGISQAKTEVNTNPTEAQKTAGNYKKGHISVNGFDITIEQPKGSVRSGVDADGREWSQTMNNTYGYYKGTKGKDGDQIDVFLGDKLDSDKIFVVDQINKDGSFDEHKVMMGFVDAESAKEAYLSNYEGGWQGLGNITEINIDAFREWAANGTRKLKSFADYKEFASSDNHNEAKIMFRDGDSDLAQEHESIIAHAKADGTYMKAPNGEPTNLSDGQWVQVRTKAFKKWFGEWEKVAHIEKLSTSTPIEITGREIAPSDDIKQYRKNALEYGKTLRGEYVNRDTNAIIVLSRSGLTELMQHDSNSPEHLQSVAAIPGLIENAIYIDSVPNEDTKVKADKFDYYVAGLKVDGIDYTVKMIVAEIGGQRYYEHKLTSIEKGSLLNLIRIPNLNQEQETALSDIKDKRLLSILQTSASKVVDENGEPKIVYHGSRSAGFTEFEEQWGGIFFTDNGDVATVYSNGLGASPWTKGDNGVYRAFLNARKPIEIDAQGREWVRLGFEFDEQIFDSAEDLTKYIRNNQLDYDGVITKNVDDGDEHHQIGTNYTVILPTQIKDAYANNGTFDVSNSNILYRDGSIDKEAKLGHNSSESNTVLESIHDDFGRLENDYHKIGADKFTDNNEINTISWRERKVTAVQKVADYLLERIAIKPKINIFDSSINTDVLKWYYDLYGNKNNGDFDVFLAEWKEFTLANEFFYDKLSDEIFIDLNECVANNNHEQYYKILFHEITHFCSYKIFEGELSVIWTLNKGKGIFASDQFAEIYGDCNIRSRGSEVLAYSTGYIYNIDGGRSINAFIANRLSAKELVSKLGNIDNLTRQAIINTLEYIKYGRQTEKITIQLAKGGASVVSENDIAGDPKNMDSRAEKQLRDDGQNVSDAFREVREGEREWLGRDGGDSSIHPRGVGRNSGVREEIERDEQATRLYAQTSGEIQSRHRGLVVSDSAGRRYGVVEENDGLQRENTQNGTTVRRSRPSIGAGVHTAPEGTASQRAGVAQNPQQANGRGNRDTRNGSGDSETLRTEQSISSQERIDGIKASVEKLSSELNTPITIITDVSEITDDNQQRLKRKRGAKGWYDGKTNEVVIVLPNATSRGDAVATVLHEVVAHKGLKEMFGTHFDSFLTDIYNNVDAETRRKIATKALHLKLDTRLATEEYLAELAEQGIRNPYATNSVWQTVKKALTELLRKIGVDIRLTDNDLRYLLWKSYNRLNTSDGIIARATKISADNELSELLLRADNVSQKDVRIEKLRNSKPVEITGNEIEPSDDHKLTSIEKGQLLTHLERLSTQSADSNSPLFDIKDKRLIQILQTSEVEDAENGVVTHDAHRFRDTEPGNMTSLEQDSLQPHNNTESVKKKRRNKKEIIQDLRVELKELKAKDRHLETNLRQSSENIEAITEAKDAYIKAIDLRNKATQDIKRQINDSFTPDMMPFIGKNEITAAIAQFNKSVSPEATEKAIQRITDIALDAEIKHAKKETERLLSLKVQGESKAGVAIAKHIDDNTRILFGYVQKNLNRNIETLRSEIDERKHMDNEDATWDVSDDMKLEALYLIELYQNTNEVGEDYLNVSEQIDRASAELVKLKTYRVSIDKIQKGVEQNSAKDKLKADKKRTNDQIVVQQELLTSLSWQLYEIKQDYADKLASFNYVLNSAISDGRSEYLQWVKGRAAKDASVLHMAFDAISDKDLAKEEPIDITPGRIAKNTTAVKDFFKSSLHTMNYELKRISSRYTNGESPLYDNFMRGEDGYLAASGGYYDGYKQYKDAIDNKVAGLFGKNYDKDGLVKLHSEARQIDTGISITVLNNNKRGRHSVREISIGQALNLYAINNQVDGEVKLRSMGISEQTIAEVVESLDKIDSRYIQFANWVVHDFLPKTREKYNATHLRVFGTQMDNVDNYWPLSIQKSSVRKEFDGKVVADVLPTTATGSIIKRKPNTTTIDVTVEFFEKLLSHGMEMEHWNAYTPIVSSMNKLLSSTAFGRSIEAQQRGSLERLKTVASIAAEQYSMKVNEVNKLMAALSKMAASSKISFKLWTALKQLASLPAYIAYSSDSEFYKILIKIIANPVNYHKHFQWCLENIPSFRKRWEGRMAGNEKLAQDSYAWLDKGTTAIGKYGFAPNAFVDAVACCLGAVAAYQYKLDHQKQRGKPAIEADRLAKIDAARIFNESQQSSEGAFLSKLQKDRDLLSVSVSMFQNSQMAYARQIGEGINELGRGKIEEIEALKNRYMSNGLNEEQAKIFAIKDVSEAKRTAIFKLATYGFIMPFTWSLASCSLPWMFGVGDDDDNSLADKAIRALFTGPVQGMTAGGVVSSVVDGFDFAPMMVISEMHDFYKNYKDAIEQGEIFNPQIAYTTLDMITTFGFGVDMQTFENIYKSVEGVYYKKDVTAEEFLYFISAPKSAIRTIVGKKKEGETILEYTERVHRAYSPFSKPVTSRQRSKYGKQFRDNDNASNGDRP